MKLTSSAFENGTAIPPTYTQEGENWIPPLTIDEVPSEAKSLALIVDDPDAPRGTFTHWVLFNIDPRIGSIDENAVPNGAAQGLNSAGQVGYRGPKPPNGTHRYFFRLHALNTRLTLADGATREQVEAAFHGRVVATAELMGRYTTGSATAIR